MLKSLVISALDRTGIAAALSPIYAGRGVIFAGHRVIRDGELTLLPGNAITESQLDSIVKCIRRSGWSLISLDDVPALLESRSRERFACITLDDGFADNWTTATPVLTANEVPFSVFPVVGFITRSTTPNQELLEWILINSDDIDFEIPDVFQLRTNVRSVADKKAAFAQLAPFLWKQTGGLRQALESELSRQGHNLAEVMNKTFLSWDQLTKLAHTRGATIGTHSLTHRPLAALDVKEAREELLNSRDVLEKNLSVKIRHTAYPFGSHRECGPREFSLARDTGYRIGLTTRPGNIYKKHSHSLLALPRVTISMVPHASSDGFIRTSLMGARNAVLNGMRRISPRE